VTAAWVKWMKAGKQPESPAQAETPPPRAWQPIRDKFAPGIETAFQPYISDR
jgi:hypothetical protein